MNEMMGAGVRKIVVNGILRGTGLGAVVLTYTLKLCMIQASYE